MLMLCFPYSGSITPLVFISLVPLLIVEDYITENKLPSRNVFLHAFICFFIYNLGTSYWIYNSSTEGGIFAFIFNTTMMCLAFQSFHFIKKHLGNHKGYLSLPFVWLGFEHAHTNWEFSHPWLSFGNVFSIRTNWIQWYEYTGISGGTLWVIVINLLFFILLRKWFAKEKTNKVAWITGLVLSVPLIFSLLIKWSYENKIVKKKKPFEVVIVQPNIDPNKKWDYSLREETMNLMDSLYEDAISMKPDLIIFPETALPSYLKIETRIRKRLQKKVNESQIPILIGTVDRQIDQNGKKSYFNSSMYLSPHSEFSMYDKIHLVPFAEYDLIPSALSPLADLNLNINRGLFKKGENYARFRLKDLYFSNLICYESSFPRYARRFVANGADFLTIQANDGWLGTSAGPFQHFAQAKLRAIENRIPIVRGGNTGISGYVLPTGEVIKKTSLGKQEIIKEEFAIYKSGTFYSFYGDIFAVMSFIFFLFIGPVNCLKE